MTAMLRPRVLQDALQQVETAGVSGVLLFNRDGLLLASHGFNESDASVTSALIATMWAALDRAGSRLSTRQLLVDCEKGRIVATRCAPMLLALRTDKQTNVGLALKKLEALAAYLEPSIAQVAKNA